MRKNIMIGALLVLSAAAQAKETRTLTQTFELADSKELEIQFPIGKLKTESHTGKTIEVTIVLEPAEYDLDNMAGVLEDVQLDSRRAGDDLSLSINNKYVKQHWTVKVPESMELDVEIDVGNVKLLGLNNDADVEIGVGNVNIESSAKDFRRVRFDSGVGKTRVSDLPGEANTDRNMVGETLRYRGDGEHSLDIEVGVGNITLRR
ncbi:hypothetical protein L1285_10270 [Pseudoalteromonas sp. DL2-H2.2]|uniref:Adhesin domain-containing protein n=1 Tax=Pseudoalteromonas rubra TaxID=43658 RepID=A0A0F4QHN2_9GAMM|nr:MULTISPECIES: hypothetical protein [Pseudoalteromonas]KJZ07116.1 hypothetical protein TW77_16675 [Pseudoalteromonas rubra]MCF2908702.1 hypothetical protein [Pseudoalteromonas sp. DL2-H2.2]